MKRLTWLLIIALALVACSRKGPAPTGSPSPTSPDGGTPMPQTTTIPQGSSRLRVTILPSATRLGGTPESESGDAGAPPAGGKDVIVPTAVPRPTATPIVVGTESTATPRPTLPLDSPLPTPTLSESPLAPPSGTPSPTSDAAASPTPTAGDATSTPTAPADASPTPTPTVTSPPPNGGWAFQNVFTYYDEDYQEFYVWGEVVNNDDVDQSIASFYPFVYDNEGDPVTSKDDVDATGTGYKELREGISIAPGRSLSFSFLVFLPPEVTVEENYDFFIEGEPADPVRDDLDVTSDDYDAADWPDYFLVEGTFNNPGPDLTEYIAVVVTLYDEDGRVIGMGWTYETNPFDLTSGEHEFTVDVEPWLVEGDLGLEVYNYRVQLFGR